MKEEYYPIPGYPGNYITKSGKTWYKPGNKRYSIYKCSLDGNWKARIKDPTTGRLSTTYLVRLLALTFVPLPPNPTNRTRILKSFQLDFDKDNIAIDNISWGNPSEIYNIGRQVEMDRAIEEHSIPDLRDGSGVYPNGIESKTKPGYYHIPFFLTPLVVNDKGKFFNVEKGIEVKPYGKESHYDVISIPWERPSVVRAHRAVAYVFCPKPDRHKHLPYSEIHVNHINFIKDDNCKNNLEWVTNEENIKHAWENGAFTHQKPVLSRDVTTGEVRRYDGIFDLYKELDTGLGVLIGILNNKRTLRFVRNGKYQYKYDDGTEWQEPVDADFFITTRAQRYFIIMNLLTGRKHVFHNATEAAAYYGRKIGGYRDAIRRKGSYTPYHEFRRVTLEDFLKD